MTRIFHAARYRVWIALGLAASFVPCSPVHAGKPIEELRAADPQGEVEIVDVSGRVEVYGWERNEVQVGGTAGDHVERVDVNTTGNRTSIHVVSRSLHMWGSDTEAHLVIHVPAKSSVVASVVSADLKVSGVSGDVKLQAVSGDVSGDVGGALRATTVSGDVHLTARSAKSIEVKTISGDIQLTGGGGEVEITTVSGRMKLQLAEVTRGRFKGISGDLSADLALAADGDIESEAVSGEVDLKFASQPAAAFDLQSFSGDIKNCFGPKAVQSRYGPGSRLEFANGDGHAHVRIHTKSGDIRLCVQGMSGAHGASLSMARVARSRWAVPYVF
jgi:DUF4097 and DUF4098 domain-containing protein YvlB